MNTYELTTVLPAKTTPSRKKALQKNLEKIVEGLKGKVTRVEDWGEIELAYKILKNTSGIFLHYNLELENNAVKQLDSKLKMEEEIIRYLLVKK